jgi:hypothetical protein
MVWLPEFFTVKAQIAPEVVSAATVNASLTPSLLGLMMFSPLLTLNIEGFAK